MEEKMIRQEPPKQTNPGDHADTTEQTAQRNRNKPEEQAVQRDQNEPEKQAVQGDRNEPEEQAAQRDPAEQTGHEAADHRHPECSCHKTKERSEKEYKDLIHRLNRIEGQVRGIRGMVEKDAYCPEILTQVAAVTAALGSFNKVLLANHIRTCVIRDIREGRDETVDELLNTLQKLMR